MKKSKYATILYSMTCGGKKTFVTWLKEREECHHTSTGDLLRGQEDLVIQETINGGELANDELVFQLIEKDIDKQPSNLIIDGCPRNPRQGPKLNEKLRSMGYEICAIHLEIFSDLARIRAVERAKKEGRMDDKKKRSINTKIGVFETHHFKVDRHLAQTYKDAYYTIKTGVKWDIMFHNFHEVYQKEKKRRQALQKRQEEVRELHEDGELDAIMITSGLVPEIIG